MPTRSRPVQTHTGPYSGYPGNYSPTTPQYVVQQPIQRTNTQMPVQRSNTFMLNLGGGQARILTENDIRALSAQGIVLVDPRTHQPIQIVDQQARRKLVELVGSLPTWKYKHEAKTNKKDTKTEPTKADSSDSASSSAPASSATADADNSASTASSLKSDKSDKDKDKVEKPKPLGVHEDDILTDCRICLCDFEDGEELVTLPCLHFFHKDEIYKWLLEDKPVCPMCMNPVMMSS